jgi:polyvinyl alcohol dehydrogenase (cytochrome)
MRLLTALLLLPVSIGAADDPPGAQLYRKHCAVCHDVGGNSRIPPQSALRQKTAGSLMKALETGVMQQQGAVLGRAERRALTSWLGKPEAAALPPSRFSNPCPDSSWAPPTAGAGAWAGWGAGLANLRFQSPEQAGFTAGDVPNLKLKWAFGIPDATIVRSQPAVFGGRVFLGTQDGTVYALDAGTGCTHWATEAAAQVRTGMVAAFAGDRTLVFFGDAGGHVYALDASTGQPAWQLRADSHPVAMVTGTPAYHDGRLYVPVSSYEEASSVSPGYVCCTFRGSVLAVEAATGKILWKTYTIAESPVPRRPTKRGAKTIGPSGAGIWSAPTLDPEHRVLYVATGDNYSDPPTLTSDAVLAVHMDSGKLLWSKQLTAGDAYNSTCPLPDKANCPDSDGPDFDFGASPLLIRLAAGRRILVLPQKSGMLHGVDPDRQGRVLWQSRVGQGGVLGGLQWGPASDGERVYAALSDMGFARTRIPNTTDIKIELDPAKGGGLFAFRTDNGERLWMTPAPGCGDRRPCSPAQSAAVSAIEGAVFSGSVDGHLRAYSTTTGKIIWDFDAVRGFPTVNGVLAKGGAFDAAGVVIAGGMMFAGSGYGQWGGLPGNVLLAFSVDRPRGEQR